VCRYLVQDDVQDEVTAHDPGRVGGRAVDIVSSVKDITEVGTQQLAGEVLAAISALRRVARRAARSAWPAQPLPSAQSELLRLAASRPGITVTEAAAERWLASNTVSTLVGRLAAAGLLERARAVSDGRSIRLTVTASGAKRIAEWRDLRADLAGRALSRLPDADHQALAAAIPALLRFAAELEEDT
jgi:DNA-binding MarR family transcriptional regulator